jgi:hemoglobin
MQNILCSEHILIVAFENLIFQYSRMQPTLYDQIGEENLRTLVDRFYDLVFENEQISHLFKNDKSEIKEKQRLFLTQFLGGPDSYSEKYGHPRLRARHMPHVITQDDAVAWLSCMSAAITSLTIEESIKDEIFKRLVPTAMFMVNRQEY